MAASGVDVDLLALQGNNNLDNDPPMCRQNYNILTETDIRQRIQNITDEVSRVLSVSKTEASILLIHYNWSVNNVIDAWFADENLVREKVGLLVKNELYDHDHGLSIVCGNCFQDNRYVLLKSTKYCGHLYCDDCWSSYIKTCIADGPQGLLLKCPEPTCRAAVGEDMMGLFVSEREKIEYGCYCVLSYIEVNKMIKWCPGPGCENAVEFVVAGDRSESCFDVTCLCSHSFCWNCTQEAHHPVDCETVMKWMLKNSSESESENVNCILAFTKPCPKCERPNEKEHGLARMTCRPPCGYQFCWLCLQDWRNHVTCNRFKGNPEEYKRQYTHYFERWAVNRNSMRKAVADLKNVVTKQIEAPTACQIGFLTETWEHIIECRRVLTWTYAYGFYLSEECEAKRNLFEYLQGEAECGLEWLQYCAERLLHFLKYKCSAKEFDEFRARLTLLTMSTRNYFDNLVTALQNGLSDVSSEGSSSGSKNRNTSSTVPTDAVVGTAMEQWVCGYCYFRNQSSATTCAMCFRCYEILDDSKWVLL